MTAAVTEDELASLRDSLRGFLRRYSPIGEVRRLMATADGYDPRVWAELAGQVGLPGLTIPEEYGGAGYGPAEQAVAVGEAGRALLCAPYLSSAVAATNVLLHAGSGRAKADLLPGLAAGDVRATAAFAERDWDQGVRHPDTMAVALGDTWWLTGTKRQVLDGATADLLLVTARTRRGPRLFAVPGPADGVARTEVRTLDQTRKMADVTLTDAPATLVGDDRDVTAELARATDLTIAAVAAEQAGAAARCVELVVEYLRIRVQFGRSLASFQALKHRCANLLTEVECARALAESAAAAGAAGEWPELATLASAAKVSCSETFAHAAAECVQLHGGIGFTWEHDAHLYFKRACGTRYLFGAPSRYRERAATGLGL